METTGHTKADYYCNVPMYRDSKSLTVSIAFLSSPENGGECSSWDMGLPLCHSWDQTFISSRDNRQISAGCLMTIYVQRRPAAAFLSEELPIFPQRLMLTPVSQAGLVPGLGGLWCCSASHSLPAALLPLLSYSTIRHAPDWMSSLSWSSVAGKYRPEP